MFLSFAVYHNIKVKYCRTNLFLERRIRGMCSYRNSSRDTDDILFLGTGLTCHRIVASICHLAGIKDIRAKIIGSTNPMNIVRAALKGLTSQVG